MKNVEVNMQTEKDNTSDTSVNEVFKNLKNLCKLLCK